MPYLEASFADRGYFGGSGDEPPQGPSVWITHSLGTILEIRKIPAECRCLIAINGFERFAAGEDLAAVPKRVLDRMLLRLEQDAPAVVAEFRRMCGTDEAVHDADLPALRRDLLALRDLDCRAEAAKLAVPVLSLQGAQDPILRADFRDRALRNVPHVRHRLNPTAGHLLPLQDPDWCAGQVAHFLEEIG
jgi:pimeloyl-[acyl-carrier protein] methyl ester esterase